MSEIPEFLQRGVFKAMELYGLNHRDWSVDIHITDKPNGNTRSEATASISSRYLNAWLEFRNDVQDDQEGLETIHHEVLHMAMHEVDHVVSKILESVHSTSQRALLTTLYEDALERTVQRLSRNIARQLEEESEHDNGVDPNPRDLAEGVVETAQPDPAGFSQADQPTLPVD